MPDGVVAVIGVQHHLLAKLFLLDHRLRSETHLTPNERDEIKAYHDLAYCLMTQALTSRFVSMQKLIRNTLREVCGIGLSNQWTPPGMFTACMAIEACKFHTPRDLSCWLGETAR